MTTSIGEWPTGRLCRRHDGRLDINISCSIKHAGNMSELIAVAQCVRESHGCVGLHIPPVSASTVPVKLIEKGYGKKVSYLLIAIKQFLRAILLVSGKETPLLGEENPRVSVIKHEIQNLSK